MLRNVVRVFALLVLLVLAAPVNPIAFAQVELTGSWAARSGESGFFEGLPVDFTGIPLNDEGRAKALAYSQSQLGMTERQCQGWPPFYMVIGPFGLRIWSDTDPIKGGVVSYTIGAWEDRPALTIWMDGRPHPSEYSPHTRAGFTTGEWEGNTLVARTTHMNAGSLRQGRGSNSDQATMTTRFFRHGDLLSLLVVIEDPVYLAEPWILSKSFQASAMPVAPTGPPCIPADEGLPSNTSVPNYLPEKNPFVNELTEKFGIPRDAVLGVPETLYPEYRKKLVPAGRSDAPRSPAR